MNKRETAVRILHIPTGIVVHCQSERTQLGNKEKALELLVAKLYRMEEEKQEARMRNLKGEKKSIEWGSQIRSYVLHPYQMVKDHRTGYETSSAERVLGGEIDAIIEEELKL